MNQQAMPNLTLFDLLARSWQRPASVTAACFAADGATVAFASMDGTVAISAVADDEPPDSRVRVSGDLGQTTIRPRAKPPTMLIATPPLGPGHVPIAAYGNADFIIGSGGGEVVPLLADGTLREPLLRLEKGIVALDHSLAGETTVASDGDKILLARPDVRPATLAHGLAAPIKTAALSGGGDHLAFGAGRHLSVWVVGDEIMPLDNFACAGEPGSIIWRSDAPWLACALGVDGFCLIDLARGTTHAVAGFPTAVDTLCWSPSANALLASGAFRIAAWAMDSAPVAGQTSGVLETGRAGLVPVTAVAAHPSKPRVAAGYANGQIVIAQIGSRDELGVRLAGGAVTSLAWSPDGNHLAVGDADGSAAIVSFPAQIFK